MNLYDLVTKTYYHYHFQQFATHFEEDFGRTESYSELRQILEDLESLYHPGQPRRGYIEVKKQYIPQFNEDYTSYHLKEMGKPKVKLFLRGREKGPILLAHWGSLINRPVDFRACRAYGAMYVLAAIVNEITTLSNNFRYHSILSLKMGASLADQIPPAYPASKPRTPEYLYQRLLVAHPQDQDQIRQQKAFILKAYQQADRY